MNTFTHIIIATTIYVIILNLLQTKYPEFLCPYTNETRKKMIYNQSTYFSIMNTMPESNTFTIITPQCMFIGNYSKHDCKSYTNMYLDLNCTLHQERNIRDYKRNPDYYLYFSPEYYYLYDAKINIYNITEHSWIRLTPGLSCQNNNICVFVNSFTLTYKNWNNIPDNGNNVTLHCHKFNVYSFI